MAYVRICGNNGITPAEYLASLPTSAGAYRYECRGAGCTWQAGSGGGGYTSNQTLLCSGKVTVTNGGFAILHTDGSRESSISGTKVIYFNKGDIYSLSFEAGSSCTMAWSEV